MVARGSRHKVMGKPRGWVGPLQTRLLRPQSQVPPPKHLCPQQKGHLAPQTSPPGNCGPRGMEVSMPKAPWTLAQGHGQRACPSHCLGPKRALKGTGRAHWHYVPRGWCSGDRAHLRSEWVTGGSGNSAPLGVHTRSSPLSPPVVAAPPPHVPAVGLLPGSGSSVLPGGPTAPRDDAHIPLVSPARPWTPPRQQAAGPNPVLPSSLSLDAPGLFPQVQNGLNDGTLRAWTLL